MPPTMERLKSNLFILISALVWLPNTLAVPLSTRQFFPQYLLPPSLDPWYSAPTNWESATPGTPLRIRKPAYPTINIKNCRDTLQILYRSSDTHGKPSWSVTTVFIPYSHSPDCGTSSQNENTTCSHGIVSYLVPSDSVYVDAAPSYLLQAQEPYGEMRDLLARGWIVAVPDYEGPTASYCAGAQAGYATLDNIRAVLAATNELGIPFEKARHAIWGYSGGAFAAGFAMELMDAYAPDLKTKVYGAAVGGPSPNLTTVARAMNKKDTAGLVVASLVGVTRQWPEASEFLLSRLKKEGPYNSTGFLQINNMVGATSLYAYAHQDVYDYFQNGAEDVWHPMILDIIDKDAVMGVVGAPPKEVPVFVYKAIDDEMSAVKETDDLVAGYCSQGSTVLYHRNKLGMHNDELWSGRLRTMDFLAHVLDDKRSSNMTVPEVGKCVTEDVAVPLDVLTLLPDWWWWVFPDQRPTGTGK
ncbi:lipase 2 [Podospora fimiseda]|uniref:Lipase 2 n=1 Tax=Podospora fimiseda TaxID=252190 RepID=A0AAN7BFY4_9PEZI|nr:lipase 2 [Podospora fimiseda]